MGDEKDQNENESSAEKAARELAEKDEKDAKDEKENESEEGNDDDSEGEESHEESDDEESSDEVQTALNLFRALNDPENGALMLEALARKAGKKLQDVASKEDQHDLASAIETLVSNELGDDFKMLAGKLSSILKKVIPGAVKASQADLEARMVTQERERVAREVKNAMNEVFDSYESIPKAVEKAMGRLMDEMPPTPGKTDPTKYFKRIVKMAADEIGFKLVSKDGDSNNHKTERNKRDATGRLASKHGAEVDTTKTAPREFKDRKSAIAQAMKDVEKQMTAKK